mgnify:CR=1 FL=1
MQDSGNCYKVRLALTQLNLPYDCVEIDILKGESRTDEFTTKNLNGRVPTLQIDETTYLPESNAILWYLAEGSTLIPEDRLSRARTLQWMFFEQYSHEPFIATSRFWISILKQPEAHAEQIASKRAGGEAALGVMENHLKSHNFFAGSAYSVADIALYAYTHVAAEGGFSLAPYPAINDWLARVKHQPGHIDINTRGY